MQVAANPQTRCVSREEVSEDMVRREREIYAETVKGKPANMSTRSSTAR